MRFVQELRLFSGGSLGNMTVEDVVGGVTQLILDYQVIDYPEPTDTFAMDL